MINKVWPARDLHTIRDMVDNVRDDVWSRTALTMMTDNGYASLTYREMRDTVRSLGNAMLRSGIRSGDRIGLLSENRNEWILTYLAVTYIGAVIVPFDSLLSEDSLRLLFSSSSIRMLFTSDRYFDKFRDLIENGYDIETTVLFDMHPALVEDASKKGLLESRENIRFETGWPELARRAAAEKTPYAKRKILFFDEFSVMGKVSMQNGQDMVSDSSVEPDDTAAIIYTSGTTGIPKGVLLSHDNLVSDGDAIQQTSVPGKDDNWILVLPLHHTFPTITGIFVPFLNYGRVTTIPTFRTDILTKIMAETKATYVPSVPLLVEKIYKRIMSNVMKSALPVRMIFGLLFGLSSFFYRAFHWHAGKYLFASVRRKAGLSNLTAFICGGGSIPPEIIHGMNIIGLRVCQGYGLTETSPVVSSCVPAHDRVGSVGLPLVNVMVRIESPDSEGNGEIYIKGPTVMKGYDGDPEATDAVLKDGWLKTGDIGYQDEDGYLYISGRLKNIIVTKGGKNIYPEEIENLLLQSPFISETVVIPKAAKDGFEQPFAVICPNLEAVETHVTEHDLTGETKAMRELIRKEILRVTEGIPSYKVPREFEITLEELPKTSTNKVKRFMFSK